MCSLVPSKSAGALAASASATAAVGGAATGSSSGSSDVGDDVVATTWYAGWHGSDFPPESISWSKYTAVTYAFAVTTPDVNTVSLEASDEELLPKFVDLAHQNVSDCVTIAWLNGSTYPLYTECQGNAYNWWLDWLPVLLLCRCD